MESPIFKKMIEDDELDRLYSKDCLPKMVDPSTEKALSCPFEKVDDTIYEANARMVGFRTTQNRILPWIKSLHIYFFETVGKRQDRLVNWVDSPESISNIHPLQKTTIDIKNNKDERLYKVTFFIKSGFIQVQGNKYHEFMADDFPILLSIVHKIAGPLDTVSDQTHVKTISQEGDEDQNPNSVSDESDNTVDEVTEIECDDNNNVSVQKEDLKRLEQSFCDSIVKLQNTVIDSKDTIIKQLESQITAIKVMPSGKQAKSDTDQTVTIHCLENKIASLKADKTTLDSQLKMEKNHIMLQKEQYDSLLQSERELHKTTRDQLKSVSTNAREESEAMGLKLKTKNEEIEKLNAKLKETNEKLNMARDEIIQLKEQIAHRNTDSVERMQMQEPSNRKPTALLVGTSNIKGIQENRLSNHVSVEKVIKYTLSDTADYLSEIVMEPTVLILHSLTNDLKRKDPKKCVEEVYDIAVNVCKKWPLVKILVSSTTPRNDSMDHSTSGQIINVLLKQKFAGVDNIYVLDHLNMLIKGKPNRDLLETDGYHLNDKGLALLASNIKRGIHNLLDIPAVARRPRSLSRYRGRGRGRDTK